MVISTPATLYVRLIRWVFARFYQEFAWTYDGVAALVSSGQWRDWTLTALEFVRGATLELGCGTGHVQLALAQRHIGFFAGLDRSPQMIRRTRRRLAQSGFHTPLVHADARALPFVSESFDTIIATFPSEYIAEDATIAEVRRVLRPGGTIAIALWARFADDSLYARLVDAAYRVTLQRSPRPAAPAALATLHRFGERFERAGMDVSFREIATSGGMVQYVLGMRREPQ
jgi:ubiquinone/menaquinone biosynthesis C-methylase UbiE